MTTIKLPHDHGQNIDKILDKMPDIEHFVEAATSFQQISDGTRLRILWLLCHSEQCVNNIAVAVGMTDAAVSHHLKNLKQNGLVKSRRSGKEVHYTLADNEKAKLIHSIIDSYFQMSCPSLQHVND